MPIINKTTQSFKTFRELGQVRYSRFRKCISQTTKTNGKIDMSAQNPHSFGSNVLKSYNVWEAVPGSLPEVYPGGVPSQIAASLPPGPGWSVLEQIAIAKFSGQLRKGRASLGVTIGSWGQSHQMILTRLRWLDDQLRVTHIKLVRDKRLRRTIAKKVKLEKEPLANTVLETEFGWRPLLSDLSSAIGVLSGDSIPPCWITGTHKGDMSYNYPFSPVKAGFEGREVSATHSGYGRVTVAATVVVSNPNAFLLNSLGLLNPLTVVWDLIPWSFVVGMFVNVNAMLSSLTAEVGLSVKNKSTTYSCKTLYTQNIAYVNWRNPKFRLVQGTSNYVFENTFRTRTVGAHPPLVWRVSIPSLNPEQLLIASSLVLQRFAKISKLLAL